MPVPAAAEGVSSSGSRFRPVGRWPAEEVERLADLLMAWISRELVRAGRDPQTYQAPQAAESGFSSSSNKTRGRKRAEAPGSRSAKASFAEPSLFDEV